MNLKIASLLVLGIILFGCGTKKNTIGETSQNSLDWNGVYLFSDEEYKRPEIQLTLTENGTYKLIVAAFGNENRNTYLEGKFEWDQQGRTIALDKEIPHLNINKLLVGENKLFITKDSEGKNLDNLPLFQKIQTDSNLTEKYWKLVSINDREVTKDDFMAKEPHLNFKSEFNRVSGSDGCNGFGGVYFLEGNKITFEKMMSTLMACPDSFVFDKFMKNLQEEVTYNLVDEETLILHSGNDTMKFKVVYF
jgi:copper homeostasis protein (lipoprotein)